MYKPKIYSKIIKNDSVIWDITEENVNFTFDNNVIRSKLVNPKKSNYASISRNFIKEDTSEISFGISWSILPGNSQVGVKFIGDEEVEYYIKYTNNSYYLFEKQNNNSIDLFPISYGMIIWFKCNFNNDAISLSTDLGNNFIIINKCININNVSIYSIASNNESYISYIGLKENNE